MTLKARWTQWANAALAPARYGVLDMGGNSWEWCLTKWRPNYTTPPDDDAAGQSLAWCGAVRTSAMPVSCAAQRGAG